MDLLQHMKTYISSEEGKVLDFEVTEELLDQVIEKFSFKGDRDELRMGLEVEQEHGPNGPGGPDCDVTGGDPFKTAMIALAHLSEDKAYYTKLKAAKL